MVGLLSVGFLGHAIFNLNIFERNAKLTPGCRTKRKRLTVKTNKQNKIKTKYVTSFQTLQQNFDHLLYLLTFKSLCYLLFYQVKRNSVEF